MAENDFDLKWEEVAKVWEGEFAGRPGGGGGKKGGGKSQSRVKAGEDIRRGRVDAELEGDGTEIEKVLERIIRADRRKGGEKFIKAYQAWVERAVAGGELAIAGEVVSKNTLKKNRAGGQNVQKNRSAVQLTHLPTLIFVRSQAGRGREINAEGAEKKLKKLLLAHRDLWLNVVEGARGKEAVRRVGVKLAEMARQP